MFAAVAELEAALVVENEEVPLMVSEVNVVEPITERVPVAERVPKDPLPAVSEAAVSEP